MKIIEAINFFNFYNQVKDKKLPLKLAYKLSKIARAVEEDRVFYQNRFREILSEYGELDEQGNPKMSEDKSTFLIQDGQQDNCLKAMNELNDLDIRFEFEPIDIEVFDDLDITLTEMNGIMPFIKE